MIPKNLYRFTLLGLFLCASISGISQDGFTLPKHLKKDKISIQLVNNLVVIPVEVNGKELTFVLDTGVDSTLLFSLSPEDSLEVKNAIPVNLRGLGEGGSVPALRSIGNTVVVGEAVDSNHSIYVIFDQTLNFSTRMGVPINGILGYDFFKNFIVKTNYVSNQITFYNPKSYIQKKCRSCREFDLTFNKNKPYIDIEISSGNNPKKVTLLIDSGSSDAIWLFDETYGISETPKNYFKDYLGLGLSGSIYGKRSKIKWVALKDFKLKEVNIAFPNEKAIENVQFYEERDGSIGGDILKRFTVVMDYPKAKMILKKNRNFGTPFYYNMSGLTIEHNGMVIVKEERPVKSESLNIDQQGNSLGAINISLSNAYNFFLAPQFIVAELRENSPAAEAGIKVGDIVLKVNGKEFHKYKLFELNNLFSSKEGKRIFVEVQRPTGNVNLKFTLKKVL